MTEKEKLQQEMQRKYFELQMFDQQIKQTEQNLVLIETQLIELDKITKNIDDIKKVKKSSKILSPIGSGVYIESTSKETSHLLVNIGSNIIVKKTPEEAKEIIANQKEELKKILEMARKEINENYTKFYRLQKDIQELSSKLK